MGRLLVAALSLQPVGGARGLAGDANCDGVVDRSDVALTPSLLFHLPPSLECPGLDANADGHVSAADLTAIVRIFAPPAEGPVVSYLGLATPDGRPLTPVAIFLGRPVFWRPVGSGFQLVVEGRAGANGQRPGSVVFAADPRDPNKRPDLQVLVQRPLGDGSPEVCIGGVPGFDPPEFSSAPTVSHAINDLGCNFTLSTQGLCTLNSYGQPSMVSRTSQIQYCATIARALAFPSGDTIVAVRLRDLAGVLGPIESIVVRVGSPPPTATITAPSPLAPSPTVTRTQPPANTPTPTALPTDTPPRPTGTWSVSPTPPAVATPSGSPTSPPLPRSPSPTLTATHSVLPVTRTPTPGLRTATPSPTLRPTLTPSTTIPPTPSATRSVTRTLTPTPGLTRTPTRTSTPTQGSQPRGPVITYFGLTRADDTRIEPIGTTHDGIPIFRRVAGAGFSLVVEGRPGVSGSPVGTASFQEGVAPDLQVFVSRPLGDGSPAVCDRIPPNTGGVPAIDSAGFGDRPEVIDALNDLGCRFLDGAGQPRARNRNDACVLRADGGFDFVDPSSTVQFCGFVDVPIRFPSGDTLVTVRLRDTAGNVGAAARILIRIAP